jgi:hypothetical protein
MSFDAACAKKISGSRVRFRHGGAYPGFETSLAMAKGDAMFSNTRHTPIFRAGVPALAFALCLLSTSTPVQADTQAAAGFSTINSFSPAVYPDRKMRQFLVKNGRVYRRIEPNWNTWEDISHLFNGVNQVGVGEITAYDVEVYQDGLYRMFLTRGGQVHRITSLEGGGWSAWENITGVFAPTGTAPITSFTSALYADGLLRQFVVRGGRVYRRTQESMDATRTSRVGTRALPVVQESWSSWSDITSLFAGVGDATKPIVSFHAALYVDGKLRQFVGRGGETWRRTEPNWETWENITSLFTPVGGHADPRVHAPIYKRAMVIEYNPLMATQGNRPLNQVRNWREPRVLEQQYVENLEQASTQVVQYAVARHVRLNEFPPFAHNVPRFTEQEFLQCTQSYPFTCRDNGKFDYVKVLTDHRVCELANASEIDEVWIMAPPFAGLWEANMTGPGAFHTNGSPVAMPACNVKVNIMGFNYEREVTEMLENMGHRVEGVMTRYFGRWRNSYLQRPNPFPDDANDFERFTARGFDHTTAACGNIHGALNTPQPDPVDIWNYDWDNPNPEVSTCEDWENYPGLTGATTVISCAHWGCTKLGWERYWFGKIPAFAGTNPRIRNNWWLYVLDWDRAMAP